MAAEFHYFPFDDGPGSVSLENRWREMMQYMRTTGIITEWGVNTLDPSDADLAVTPNTGLSIKVAVGEAWVEGHMFQQLNDYFPITIPPNTSGNPRIDLLVLRGDWEANTIFYVLLEGTPAENPVAPSPVQNDDIWDLPLASIQVNFMASDILAGNITDLRVRSVQDGTGVGPEYTIASTGPGETIISDSVPPDWTFKSLVEGTNIELVSSSESITINATGDAGSVTLNSAGGTYSLVSDNMGPTLGVKGLTSGSNVTITDSGTDLTISADSGDTVTLDSAGGTETLVVDGTGPDLSIKGLSAGSGVTLTADANSISIAATGGDPGDVTLTSGDGDVSLVTDGIGPDLEIRSLSEGTNVTLTADSDTVTIDSATNASIAGSGLGDESLVATGGGGPGDSFTLKDLVEGSGIALSSDNNTVTIASTNGADTVTLTSAGGSESLVTDGTGPDLEIKGLSASGTVSLTPGDDDITISASSTDVTLLNAGSGQTLVVDSTGPSLSTKSLSSGTGITLTATTNDIQIVNSSPASGVTLSTSGSGTTLITDGTGPSLAIRTLSAGSGVSFNATTNDIEISATGGGGYSGVYSTGYLETGVLFPSDNTEYLTIIPDEDDPLNMNNQQRILIPEDGIYLVTMGVNFIGGSGTVRFRVTLTRSDVEDTLFFTQFSSDMSGVTGSRVVPLLENDEIRLYRSKLGPQLVNVANIYRAVIKIGE